MARGVPHAPQCVLDQKVAPARHGEQNIVPPVERQHNRSTVRDFAAQGSAPRRLCTGSDGPIRAARSTF
eukprot:scaffold4501_cov395-Prasinococcus_capsulatus_cf.AAC.7